MKVLKWVLIVLGVLIVIVAAIYGGAWFESKHPNSILRWNRTDEGKNTVATTSGDAASTTANTTTDSTECTAGTSGCKTPGAYDTWLTYTNKDVGYTLKYPQGWKITERNGTSEVTETPVKYITVTSADQKYFFHLGLKKKTDNRDFGLSERTGIGAGDDVAVTAKKFAFIGDNVIPYAHVWENKTAEFFFKDETQNSAKFTGEYVASYSPDYDVVSDSDINMSNDLLDIPILIMKSVAWL